MQAARRENGISGDFIPQKSLRAEMSIVNVAEKSPPVLTIDYLYIPMIAYR
jgi:hypothetical protein